jgi:hypothetical protein
VSYCCSVPNEQMLIYIITRPSYIWWGNDDDDVLFVLDQYAYLDFL